MTDHHSVPTRSDDIFCKSRNMKCCFFSFSHSLFLISPNPRYFQKKTPKKNFPKALWQKEVSKSMRELHQRKVVHSKGLKYLWATGSHNSCIIWIRYVLVSLGQTVITYRSEFVMDWSSTKMSLVQLCNSPLGWRFKCVLGGGFCSTVIQEFKLMILPPGPRGSQSHAGDCHRQAWDQRVRGGGPHLSHPHSVGQAQSQSHH